MKETDLERIERIKVSLENIKKLMVDIKPDQEREKDKKRTHLRLVK